MGLFDWFKKGKKKEATPAAKTTKTAVSKEERAAQQLVQKLQQLQQDYWTFDQEEQSKLLASFEAGDLSMPELYRLHHLNCMEMVEEERKTEFESGELEMNLEEVAVNPTYQAISKQLMGLESPYKPRVASIWTHEDPQNAPGSVGELVNISLTHFGALEVFQLDENNQPIALQFIPFDTINGVFFQGNSLFRYCKVFYEYGKGDEIFLTSSIYGLSFHSKEIFDTDGSMTRFLSTAKYTFESKPKDEAGTTEMEEQVLGIGLGQQDVQLVGSDGRLLMGLGRIREMAMALELSDPKFREKCEGRGLDPDNLPTASN